MNHCTGHYCKIILTSVLHFAFNSLPVPMMSDSRESSYRHSSAPFITANPSSTLSDGMRNQQCALILTWMSLGMTSVPFLALCAAAALLTYFFSRKKVTSQEMKATRGARYWSLVQKVLSLFRVTGTYKGFGRWWGRSN